jgi:hypothetical protein
MRTRAVATDYANEVPTLVKNCDVAIALIALMVDARDRHESNQSAQQSAFDQIPATFACGQFLERHAQGRT